MVVSYFNIYGIKMKIETTNEAFTNFIKENYSLFSANSVDTADVNIRFSEEAGTYAKQKSRNYDHIGNGIKISDHSVYWKNEYGFHLIVHQNDSGLSVRAFHKELLDPLSTEEQYKNFQRCMRWIAHYPLFTILQYYRGWNILHGAAVSNGETTVAFCGLNKVGKSTLATYFCQKEGYNILTDNFLLVDREQLYAFPEVIRLGSRSMDEFELEPLWNHSIYNKKYISPSKLGTTTNAKPDAFFIVSQGENLFTEKIGPKNAWQSLENLHSMLGEFPQHAYMAAWPLISGKTREPIHRDMEIFHTPWYHLSYKPNWQLQNVFDEVEKCI